MKIGILGGGQLARMIALAGYPLNQDFIVLDPSEEAGAVGLGQHLHGAYDDPELLAELARTADVVTYEFENVPSSVANYLAQHTKVYPGPNALAIAQDRLLEKNFFNDLSIPTAPYTTINSLSDLETAMESIQFPAILKSRRMGYDGKGQIVLRSSSELAAAWEAMQGAACIVEGFVDFKREISIIAARSLKGETVFYPVSENKHEQGILRVAQCRPDDPMQSKAESYVQRLLNELEYVGVVALELFDTETSLIANEFAPRVHNSGHWTIEGCETSQFENHLRAILDLPLGNTTARGYSAMVNFIGNITEHSKILALPDVHLHLYDKSPRKGRKLAHATVRSESLQTFNTSLAELMNLAEMTDDS